MLKVWDDSPPEPSWPGLDLRPTTLLCSLATSALRKSLRSMSNGRRISKLPKPTSPSLNKPGRSHPTTPAFRKTDSQSVGLSLNGSHRGLAKLHASHSKGEGES